MKFPHENSGSKCNICGEDSVFFSTAQVIRYKAAYYECLGCGSLQIKNPHWVKEAHSRAISILDTGLVARCLSASRLIGTFLFLEGRGRAPGIDWAGGTGLLTRLLRDQGYQVKTFDSYADGELAVGFVSEGKNLSCPMDFLSAIECFEHLEDPTSVFMDLVVNKEYFIFTTELLPSPTPDPMAKDWWYYMPESGQHITFATSNGLDKLSKILGFRCYSTIGSLHIFSRNKLRLLTRVILSKKITRAVSIIVIPEILNRKYSLTWSDKEELTKLL